MDSAHRIPDAMCILSGAPPAGRGNAFYRFGAIPYRIISGSGRDAESAVGGRQAIRLTKGTEIATIACFVGGVPERSKGADCKSAGSAFEGSNPSPSTNRGSRPREAGKRFGRAAPAFESSLLCRPMRGCSSMVEQKPSKLTTRVRFPSPAPRDLVWQREYANCRARRGQRQNAHVAQW